MTVLGVVNATIAHLQAMLDQEHVCWCCNIPAERRHACTALHACGRIGLSADVWFRVCFVQLGGCVHKAAACKHLRLPVTMLSDMCRLPTSSK